jgi:cell division septation protein DedD
VNDEGFREIQLNGKQLVFLFMAATVILVVSFLFGVLVGRGVHSPETVVQTAGVEVGPDPGAAAVEPSMSASPSTSQGAPSSSSAPAGADAGGTADLSYPKRLTEEQAAEEKLKKPSASQPSAPAPGVQAPVAAAPAAAPKPPPPAPAKPTPAATTKPAPASASTPARSGSSPIAAIDPSGPGFAVQVSIFETRQEADRLAQQLVAKGYPAFVLDPAKGAAKPFFRVRVGKYRNRQDAEEIQARLQKNEQFTPWIAR